MIRISRNITQIVEARCLDANKVYFARLWCEETGVEGKVIKNKVEVLNSDTSLVYFEFKADYFDCFEIGDKISLSFWEENREEDWRQQRMYVLIDSHVAKTAIPKCTIEVAGTPIIRNQYRDEQEDFIIFEGYIEDVGEVVMVVAHKWGSYFILQDPIKVGDKTYPLEVVEAAKEAGENYMLVLNDPIYSTIIGVVKEVTYD